ncbi:hypothetical protein LA080_004082 [Diaporthe eres]|nr:hypothetical protein LA080_004082 [Diaporthe eres]
MPQGLEISFERTIHVPDNKELSHLPPSLGSFPVYKVQDYAHRLPQSMVDKGGVFFPMHQKEAMWINFKATAPFMIKIYCGGINVVSGEHAAESANTKQRRAKLLTKGELIQDYVVLPEQPWIDGVAIKPAVVRQFVAMPLGQGYTVEAQLTGGEVVGGLMFEITPAFCEPKDQGPLEIYINTMTGRTITMLCFPDDDIYTIKSRVQELEGLTPDRQRLIYEGRQLEDAETLRHYNIEKVTGEEPPACPTDAEAYAKTGVPFFDLYEENSTDVSGAETFGALQSINEIDMASGQSDGPEPAVHPRVTSLRGSSLGTTNWNDGNAFRVEDPDGLLSPGGPYRDFRTLADLEAEVRDLKLGSNLELAPRDLGWSSNAENPRHQDGGYPGIVEPKPPLRDAGPLGIALLPVQISAADA